MRKWMKQTRYFILVFFAMFLLAPVTARAYAFTKTVDMQISAPGKYFFDGEAMSDDSEYEDYVVYHKFSVNKTALIELYGDSYYWSGNYWEDQMHGDFTLCDASKNPICDITDYHDSEDTDIHGYWDYAYFLVKPGTYYLRYIGSDGYKLHLDYKYCSRKAATSKKKAKTIKAKQKVSGFFYKGEKKTHWYKLKLTKKKKIRLSLTSYGSGAMRVYLMGPRILAKNSYIWCYDTSYTDIMGNRYNRSLSKGTYYLKVVKENAATSGMYVVSWR